MKAECDREVFRMTGYLSLSLNSSAKGLWNDGKTLGWLAEPGSDDIHDR